MAFLFWRGRRTAVWEASPTDHRFHIFGGRRYLAAMPYPLPKDMGEINRLDFQHYVLRTGLGSNFIAPVEQPAAILDVGTGSGRWAREIASQFPGAQVIGTDLVPPAVDERKVLGHGLDHRPPNYAFVSGNVLEGLPFPGASFDFVHQRLLITAIPAEHWPHVIRELVRVTRLGGWVELAECGVPEAGGPGYMGLWGTWIEFLRTRGVDFTLGDSLGQMLTAAGLARVNQRGFSFPMGAWGGHIGRASATDCLAVGKALRTGVIASGVCTEATYDGLYAAAEREFASRRRRGRLPFYLAYGQRLR